VIVTQASIFCQLLINIIVLAAARQVARRQRWPDAGQNVGHCVILSHPQRVPHRHDAEGAADPHARGNASQMYSHHQDVRDQFRAFRLELRLGNPEGVVTALVHAF
jgi:hypothetical protein